MRSTTGFAMADRLLGHPEIFIALQERALQEQKIFVSAFDDPYIIAGQVGHAQTPDWLPGCMQAMHSASSACFCFADQISVLPAISGGS